MKRICGFVFLLALMALLPLPDFSVSTARAQEEKAENPVVFVHGAWGGRHHWQGTVREMEKTYRGPIYRASLTGLGQRVHLASPAVNLSTHIQDVKNLIEFEDLNNVILIGHSYGGGVISGVADLIPERLAKVVYLDASLLDDGETFFLHDPDPDRLEKLTARAKADGDGWLIPVDWPNTMRDVPHPLATLTQPIVLKNPLRKKIPGCYWIFTDGGELEKDKRLFYYQRAQKRGYDVKAFKWGHNPQREKPAEVVQELLDMLESVSSHRPTTDLPPADAATPLTQ